MPLPGQRIQGPRGPQGEAACPALPTSGPGTTRPAPGGKTSPPRPCPFGCMEGGLRGPRGVVLWGAGVLVPVSILPSYSCTTCWNSVCPAVCHITGSGGWEFSVTPFPGIPQGCVGQGVQGGPRP